MIANRMKRNRDSTWLGETRTERSLDQVRTTEITTTPDKEKENNRTLNEQKKNDNAKIKGTEPVIE